jgi:hypothetical protein
MKTGIMYTQYTSYMVPNLEFASLTHSNNEAQSLYAGIVFQPVIEQYILQETKYCVPRLAMEVNRPFEMCPVQRSAQAVNTSGEPSC